MEMQRFLLAMIAPVGITFMELIFGIPQMFMAGLVFTGLVVVAAILRRIS